MNRTSHICGAEGITMHNWFIEETMPDGSYRVVSDNLSIERALGELQTMQNANRLEVWSRAHVNSPKGFAPVAYKENGRVLVSNTLRMLMH